MNDSALFSLNNIATYRGAGIDAQGKGFADIDNELDAVAAAANYLNSVGYQSNPGLAITRYECNSCSYPNARPYAFNVLRSGAAIQMAYAQAIDQGLIEEVPLDDALADDDFDWSDYFEGGGDLTLELGSLITPRPDITFEQLRPKFSWRTSEVVHRWEQRVCRTQTVDGESVETCSWEPREKREERKLLSSAETYEGRYHHFYESTVQTVNSGSSNRRNERILSEEQVNVEGPDEEDYMKPFFDVLENNGVYLDLDVTWVLELLEMFEDYYVPEGPGTDIYDPDVVSEIEGSENWFWPVPTSNRVTSCFGYRNVSTGSTYHEGLDVGAPTPGQTGVRVHAIESGVVTQSGYHSVMGNYVRIQHDTFDSRYLHFASSPAVSVGDSITRGQFIGIMGTTGSSTGIHLHLDIYINGARQDPLRYWDTMHLAITGSNCGAYR
ncbi:hypothetical protein DH09_00515 (plasmid) [Bacillaceae bacterium JMAK1]|nr:hypothetical protein DH09_00515 [Bacillaceae bacterium JMAK1]